MIQGDRIIDEIVRLVKNGRNTLTSTEIHKNLGLSPNKFPNVCNAMRNKPALTAGGIELIDTEGRVGDKYTGHYKVIVAKK